MLPPVVLAADYAGTVQATERIDVRVRDTVTTAGALTVVTPTGQNAIVPAGTVPTQTPPPVAGIDFDDRASVTLRAYSRTTQLSLTYAPTVTLQDAENGINAQNEPLVLQSLMGLVGWHSRSTTLLLTEGATYGTFNSAYQFAPGAALPTPTPGQMAPGQMAPAMGTTAPVGGTTATTTQLAPRPINVYFGSTLTSLTLAQRLDRRSQFTLGATYAATGGLDASSRLALPTNEGPRADASFDYALSRSLHAVTLGHAEMTSFGQTQCYTNDGTPIASALCEPRDGIARISEGLRDALSRSTTISVDAGASYARVQSSHDVPYSYHAYPSLQAGLLHVFGQRGRQTFTANVLFTPLLDIRTGLVSDSLQGQLALTERLSETVTITADAIGGQTFPTDAPLAAEVVRGTTEARFRSDRLDSLVFILGENAQWQNQGVLGGFFSIFGYLAVAVSTRALRL